MRPSAQFFSVLLFCHSRFIKYPHSRSRTNDALTYSRTRTHTHTHTHTDTHTHTHTHTQASTPEPNPASAPAQVKLVRSLIEGAEWRVSRSSASKCCRAEHLEKRNTSHSRAATAVCSAEEEQLVLRGTFLRPHWLKWQNLSLYPWIQVILFVNPSNCIFSNLRLMILAVSVSLHFNKCQDLTFAEADRETNPTHTHTHTHTHTLSLSLTTHTCTIFTMEFLVPPADLVSFSSMQRCCVTRPLHRNVWLLSHASVQTNTTPGDRRVRITLPWGVFSAQRARLTLRL